MLRGNSPARIDEKGRLKIPAVFRADIEDSWGSDFYITSMIGESAWIYPLIVWQEIEERLAKLPSLNPTKKKFLDRTNYYGQLSSMDKQEYWELTGWSPIRQVQVNFLPVFGSVFHIELDLCLLPYFFGALQRNCQVFSSGHRVLWGGSVGFRHRLILVKCCPGIVSDGQSSAITVKVRLSPLRKRICLWLHHQTR